MPLPDQEAARALVQALDHLVLGIGELQTFDVVLAAGVRIRQQHERRGLLDQRRGNVALKCVLRALRGEDPEAVLLADGLLLVLGELLEATAAVEDLRSEEHTSELQSLMRISYAVFC